jgi:ER membrane protein complex subunit 4
MTSYVQWKLPAKASVLSSSAFSRHFMRESGASSVSSGEDGVVPGILTHINPPGYVADTRFSATSAAAQPTKKEEEADEMALLSKKAWEIARSPLQKVFMVGFMLYMSGSGVHLMSLMMIFMATFQTLSPLFTVSAAFQVLEKKNISLVVPKLLFILLHLVGVGAALYKYHSLGFFRPSPAHFLAQKPLEVMSANF